VHKCKQYVNNITDSLNEETKIRHQNHAIYAHLHPCY